WGRGSAPSRRGTAPPPHKTSGTRPEKFLHLSNVGRLRVIRQALHKYPAVGFFQNPIIEQRQQATVVQRANQASKALFQRDDRAGHLVIAEGIAAGAIDRLHARRHNRVARHRERQPVDNHTTQLLALHVHTLPERRGSEQHRVRCEPKLLKQRGFWRVSLLEHGEINDAEKLVVDIVHLRVAGEEHEGAAARDLEEPTHHASGLRCELRSARIGQVGRDVKDCLAFVVEMRGDNELARMVKAKPLPDVVEAAAHSERCRCKNGGFELRPEAFAQDGADFYRRGLQVDVAAATRALHLRWLSPPGGARRSAKTSPFDPEDRVRVFVLHHEAELNLQLLRPPREREYIVRLLREAFELGREPRQRMIEREEFVAIFFQKFAARVEGNAPFVRRQQREEQLRTLAQRLNRARHLRRVQLLALQQVFGVPCQFLHAQIAYRNAKVIARDLFKFVRFVENNRAAIGQHAGIGRAIGFELDGEIGKKKVMVDDDDVALGGAAPHLGNEAAFPLLAFLTEAGIGARVELVPKRARFGQFGQFGAVAGARCFFPCRNRAVVLDLLKSAQNGLIGEFVELLTAEIVVAAFHVADGKLAASTVLPSGVRNLLLLRSVCTKQRTLQKRHVFEEKLLLKVFCASRNDHALARSDDRQKIG